MTRVFERLLKPGRKMAPQKTTPLRNLSAQTRVSNLSNLIRRTGLGFVISFGLIVPLPATAWEFSTTPVCTLTHSSPEVSIVLTNDPAIPEYALTLTLTDGEWAASPTFGIGFEGGYQNTLGTDRHQIKGPHLRVADSGFGNVLDGLEFADTATAYTQNLAVALPLEGIAAPMKAFRACPVIATS